MKKGRLLLLVLGRALAMTGCIGNESLELEQEDTNSAGEAVAPDEPASQRSVQYINDYNSINGEIQLTSLAGMHFTNLRTGAETVVCSVAGYRHTEEEKDICTSQYLSSKGASIPVLYEGTIYCITSEG